MSYSYDSLRQYLNGKVDRPAPEVANNTRVIDHGESIAVRLHETDVITFHSDGRIVLNSGGWRTVTTKQRINSYLDGWWLYQEKGEWYLTDSWDSKGFVFADGLTIGPNMRVTGAGESRANLSRDINQFARGYAAAFVKGDIDSPSGGDCWFCVMMTKGGESLGDATGDASHLLSHVQESYFVPALLINAIKAFPVAPLVGSYIRDVWNGGGDDCQWIADVAQRQIRSSVARYLKIKLAVAG